MNTNRQDKSLTNYKSLGAKLKEINFLNLTECSKIFSFIGNNLLEA